MRNVRVLKTLDYPPFWCFKCKCGNDTRDFYIDLGIDSEYDGAIFLCNLCMQDTADQTGLFISIEKHNEAMVEQAYQVESYKKLIQKVDSWNHAFQKLTDNNMHDFFNNLELILNGPRIDESVIASQGSSDTELTESIESVESDNSGAIENNTAAITIPAITFS